MSETQRRSFSWSAAIIIAVAAGAFAVGRAIPRETAATGSPPPAQPAGGAAPTTSRTAGPSSRTLDQGQLDAIRSAVRDEVNAALTERGVERGAEEPPPDEPAPEAPDSVAAVASARALVESARRTGRWRREDAASLRSAIQKMSAAERDEILSTLIPAVNRGEIKPDEPSLLF